jgi:hypothetical protein
MKTLIAFLLGTTAAACSKEEYRAKFGVLPTYELLATPAPRVEDNNVVATVRYLTKCSSSNGGSTFTAVAKELPPGMDTFDVVLLSRGEPECANPNPFTDSWTGEIRVPMPVIKNSGFISKPLMLAFPPDGQYEIFKLRNGGSGATAASPPARVLQVKEVHKEEATEEEVQAELATHTPEDSIAFLAHCDDSKNVTPCCSDRMVAALRIKVELDASSLTSGTNESIVEEAEVFAADASAMDALMGSMSNL